MEGFLIKQASCFLQDLMPQENWKDEHHKRTPERFAQMLLDLTTREPFEFTTFPADLNEMIVMRQIPFVSLCAHHIIPFQGVAHVAYIPNKQMAGLSKLARTVQYWAKGLWTQEGLTERITLDLQNKLQGPLGVAVVMEAEHLCMSIRGVKAPGVKTITSKMLGVFLDPSKGAREEFLNLIRTP